jgi:hypothetical protein
VKNIFSNNKNINETLNITSRNNFNSPKLNLFINKSNTSTSKNSIAEEEKEFNKGSFLKNLIINDDSSLISNSNINETSANQSRCASRTHRSELNSTINLKENEMEINELSDDEMEDFIVKLKNAKVGGEDTSNKNSTSQPHKLKEINKENFMSFNIEEQNVVVNDKNEIKKKRIKDFRQSLREQGQKSK